VLIDRFVPIGTAAAAAAGGQEEANFGTEVLPAVLAQRHQNRGFEAVAIDNGKIYAFMQSPLRNPVDLSNGELNAMRNIRVVEFDPATHETKQFIYVLDNANLGSEPNTRADKIGEAVSFGNGEFLVLERDDDSAPGDSASSIEKKIYRFNLVGATDVSEMTGTVGSTGKTVDQLTVEEMVANGIHPIEKILHVDLNEAGYNQVQKVEGLTLIDPQTLAVLNDNNFGVASIIVNSDGTFTLNYQPEPIQLGIIETTGNGLDASDRDAKINIRQWPVKGLYLPDAIAAYKVGGKTFLITANEGDAREYEDVLEEAVRIGDDDKVVLDPAKFPNGDVLKNDANLGRLNITETMGNSDTGFTELFVFGGRSFSIWDSSGKLAYDSGDLLERVTAGAYPANFNASNDNNTFDNRSDNKGPEPEGVAIGEVLGKPYAFIGLERIGGVAVFDVSDPVAPIFVQYVNNRNFDAEPEIDDEQANPAAGDLGPEGLLFISNDASPNGRPLLVVGNEISGTTTIYQIKSTRSGRDR
jgi:Esterase-like activity of phytase